MQGLLSVDQVLAAPVDMWQEARLFVQRFKLWKASNQNNYSILYYQHYQYIFILWDSRQRQSDPIPMIYMIHVVMHEFCNLCILCIYNDSTISTVRIHIIWSCGWTKMPPWSWHKGHRFCMKHCGCYIEYGVGMLTLIELACLIESRWAR